MSIYHLVKVSEEASEALRMNYTAPEDCSDYWAVRDAAYNCGLEIRRNTDGTYEPLFNAIYIHEDYLELGETEAVARAWCR